MVSVAAPYIRATLLTLNGVAVNVANIKFDTFKGGCVDGDREVIVRDGAIFIRKVIGNFKWYRKSLLGSVLDLSNCQRGHLRVFHNCLLPSR